MLVSVVTLLLIILQPSVSGAGGKGKEVIVYHMVNVCNGDQQGDAHVLRFANDTVYVIDAGGGNGETRKRLALFLEKNHIMKIDKFFISHPHKDHYEGILDVIEAGIRIGAVYFNMPDRDACDAEKPWGCDYDDLLKIVQFIKDKKIPVESMRMGDVFFPQRDAVISVLTAYDGSNTPIGRTDINDASVIMKLVYGRMKIVFTGDLNTALSEYLVKYSYNVNADILKVPHHGTESVASNAFFDLVSPRLALVPAPSKLWLSDRSRRIRDYFTGKKIPVLVSGIDNDVTIFVYKDRYKIVKLK